jgi:hypothetical protein
MDIILTRARLTATTGLVTSPAEFLLALAHGSMDFMDARASTAARGFTVVAISMVAGIATSDAGTMVMGSAVAMSEAVAIEEDFEAGTSAAAAKAETSTAAQASMVEAASTVAGEDKFNSAVRSKRNLHTRELEN